jgi:Ca-activated chloride channel homolog
LGLITRRALIAGAAMLPAAAQEPVFTVDVRLVRMLVTVKNSTGEPVGGLDRGDFTVTDNGVPQQISVFERNSVQPLSIALLVDTSRSTEIERRYELDSIRKFLRALLNDENAGDAAALYSFNAVVTLQSGFTKKLSKLNAALGRLKSEGATALYDAIYLASDDLEAREGRRVLIVVSDGGDTFSKTKFEEALEALHRGNIVMYAVVAVPVPTDAGRNMRGENALITLSTWTGGRTFFPVIGQELEQAWEQILRDLRTQYLIGYYPKDVPSTPERFHKVSVQVNKPGFTVSARNGYFAEKGR